MKKPILVFTLMALMLLFIPISMSAESTTDRIVLSDLTYDSDLGFYYFDVSLEGSRIYTAYNMDIFLPTGISSDKDYVFMMEEGEDGIYPYTYNKIKKTYTYTHSVSTSQPSSNQLRIACTSDINEEFLETSGTLFRVYVEIDDAALAASFIPKPIVTVSGIALVVKEGAKRYVPDDFSCQPFTTGVPSERTLPINVNTTNKIGTLILPFDAALPSGVKAYTCSSIDDFTKTIILTPALSFEACKPYVIFSENGYTGNISGDVELDEDFSDDGVYTEGCLTGVLKTTVVNTGYILQNQGDGPKFYDADGASFSLPAGRCYLTPPAPLSAKSLQFSFDEATEITDVSEDIKSDIYHDLSGRRIKHPVKGFYLRGTEKVFINKP